ncbi:hypothetical protein QWZ13_03200 [Reinekea marina]|uniref:Uncharacterized protein n=1 Tax=Reinekea marina TaxID=1310421 RepID=A0ABV7WU00_9GAMM|nr:hypothetical protein [Reinekea marina]MDN3647918.1 hypothetical protein [Reinekea marina]
MLNFDGTLIFDSHDREFASSLANHIIDVKGQQLVSFKGSYEEYVAERSKQAQVA